MQVASTANCEACPLLKKAPYVCNTCPKKRSNCGYQKQLDMEHFRDLVGVNRIWMASSDSLMEKMFLPAGVVSIFGLLHNVEKDIQVYFDKEILAKPILIFHPNVNTKTIFVKTEDVLCFVEKIGFHAHIVEL